MYRTKVILANVRICLDLQYRSTVEFLSHYATDFADPQLTVSVTNEDIISERKRAESDVEGFSARASDGYLETLALYRKLADALLDFDVILFHGSALSCDGVGYIFTAVSGTGKSTHARLWRSAFGDRVTMINDDKPLLHVSDGAVTVYGTPWDGKHRLSNNVSAPLGGIALLDRAERNSVTSASLSDAIPFLLTQMHRPSDPLKLKKLLLLLDKLLISVPIYSLRCNMDNEAALVSYGAMHSTFANKK